MKNFIIVFTFFSLWLSTQLNDVVQDYVAYAFILTFGVLHGANDITLISSISNKREAVKPLLTRYLFAVAIISVLFLVSKGLALVFFVIISAYHFGEQHLAELTSKQSALNRYLYLSYGMVILFMIFVIKINKVIPIIKDVSGWVVPESFFYVGLIASSIGLILTIIGCIRNSGLKVNLVKELFYFLVLAVVFSSASLLWGFAIYFILWHSLPSLKDQLEFLYGRATKHSFMKYLKSSFLYWLVSIGGLFLLYWFLKDTVDYFITIVLYILAAITFPHVVVMSKIEHLKKTPER